MAGLHRASASATAAVWRLAARAASLPPRLLAPVNRRRAAVLLPLVLPPAHEAEAETDGGLASLHVLLTRRSAGLPTHAGQVSLPGGHLRPGEAPAAA